MLGILMFELKLEEVCKIDKTALSKTETTNKK
jgi:hypothetical protein